MMRILFLILPIFISSTVQASEIIAIRVDTGYFYDILEFKEKTAQQMAEQVTDEISKAGFNTIFLDIYSPVYGTTYPTQMEGINTESDLGAKDIAHLIVDSAHKKNLKVIAGFYANNLGSIWKAHPDWRVKTRSGRDFKPSQEEFYLSPSHLGFRSWYKKFVADFITRFPSIDGLELIEPGYDVKWSQQVDYNEAAINKFQKRYPKTRLGGPEFLQFRADELTKFLGEFCATVHHFKKECHLVQSWTAQANGSLIPLKQLTEGLGFDFNGVLNLPPIERPDWINAELVFQQWQAEYGKKIFKPEWTEKPTAQFSKFVNKRAKFILHLEFTEFSGPAGKFGASTSDMNAIIRQTKNLYQGIDFYSYDLWREHRQEALEF